jgi:hypothetical protein
MLLQRCALSFNQADTAMCLDELSNADFCLLISYCLLGGVALDCFNFFCVCKKNFVNIERNVSMEFLYEAC